jgi:hypothetical protein
LGFCGRDVPDRLKQTSVVEPVDPFEGCVFDGLETALMALPAELPPDLAHAIDLPVSIEDALDVRPKLCIPFGTV